LSIFIASKIAVSIRLFPLKNLDAPFLPTLAKYVKSPLKNSALKNTWCGYFVGEEIYPFRVSFSLTFQS